MPFSHYADLMIREGEVAAELHARMLLVVHQQSASGKVLAAAWPDWRERSGEFGLLFRVFGDAAALASYLDAMAPLATAGLVRAYPALPVPETATTVRFLRDRSHDKLSPAVARRLAKRATNRGQTWASTHAGKAREAGDHYLVLPSNSQKQVFRFYIRRERRPCEDTGSGRQYGLGHALPDF